MKFSATRAVIAAAVALVPAAAMGGTSAFADTSVGYSPDPPVTDTVNLPTGAQLQVCAGAGGTKVLDCTPIPVLTDGQLTLSVSGASVRTGISHDLAPSACTKSEGVEIDKTADTGANVDVTAVVTGLSAAGTSVQKTVGPVHVLRGVGPVFARACVDPTATDAANGNANGNGNGNGTGNGNGAGNGNTGSGSGDTSSGSGSGSSGDTSSSSGQSGSASTTASTASTSSHPASGSQHPASSNTATVAPSSFGPLATHRHHGRRHARNRSKRHRKHHRH
jgi:hypothetical protein